MRVTVSKDQVMLTQPEGGSIPDTSFGGVMSFQMWQAIRDWMDHEGEVEEEET